MADGDRPRQLHEQRKELSDEASQGALRGSGSVLPGGRERVAVFQALARDDQLGELRLVRDGSLRRATQQGRRGRRAEQVGEGVPEEREEGRRRQLGAGGITA